VPRHGTAQKSCLSAKQNARVSNVTLPAYVTLASEAGKRLVRMWLSIDLPLLPAQVLMNGNRRPAFKVRRLGKIAPELQDYFTWKVQRATHHARRSVHLQTGGGRDGSQGRSFRAHFSKTLTTACFLNTYCIQHSQSAQSARDAAITVSSDI
jgi:hypothetical protein